MGPVLISLGRVHVWVGVSHDTQRMDRHHECHLDLRPQYHPVVSGSQSMSYTTSPGFG